MSKFKLKMFHENKIVAKCTGDSLDDFEDIFSELKHKFGNKKKR